ncbi:chemotaxis protein CheW [Burkholderia cenocepacia]|uniref:chemotaxis protein CheW n=1 Tax=Burkholderia cenocepacia TaxID=95486 RepID=UPI000760D458|nr:chemotaxis protein CheW [Burkholderia cenocepacia]KWU19105.1 hypothetical protein AS149_12725 [Burkholderia cenocepacia]
MKSRLPEELTVLVFALDDDRYAVDIAHVVEIRAYQSPRRVPMSPTSVKGVLEMHGQGMPVVDLRQSLGYTDTSIKSDTMLIVLRRRAGLIAGVVNSVADVVAIRTDAVKPVPDGLRTSVPDCLQGLVDLGKHMVTLVDGARLADTATCVSG